MAEYTPSDDDVRARASMAPPGHAIESVRGRQRAEFDRWLRAHDARVRRDELRAMAEEPTDAEQAVRDLHERAWNGELDYCPRCLDYEGAIWPCATIQALDDALAAAEHRATRAEAQSDIRGRAVVIYRERAREAEAERDWNWRSSRHSKIERIKANARADRAEAEARAQRRRADDMEDNALRAQTNLRAAEERVDEWRQAALEESAAQLPDASHIAQPPRDGRMRA